MDSRRLIEPPHHERNSTALTLSLSKGSNHTSVLALKSFETKPSVSPQDERRFKLRYQISKPNL